VLQEQAEVADEEFGASHDLPQGAIQFLQNWTVEETMRCGMVACLCGVCVCVCVCVCV
jgi:hypothetical protein